MVIISGDPKYHLYRPSLSEACVSYGFLCEPFWLKLDPATALTPKEATKEATHLVSFK